MCNIQHTEIALQHPRGPYPNMFAIDDTGYPFFWREIWEAIFLTGKGRYMPRAKGARRGVVYFSIALLTIEKTSLCPFWSVNSKSLMDSSFPKMDWGNSWILAKEALCERWHLGGTWFLEKMDTLDGRVLAAMSYGWLQTFEHIGRQYKHT